MDAIVCKATWPPVPPLRFHRRGQLHRASSNYPIKFSLDHDTVDVQLRTEAARHPELEVHARMGSVVCLEITT